MLLSPESTPNSIPRTTLLCIPPWLKRPQSDVPSWRKALQSGTLELQVAEAMLLKASCHLSLAEWLELAGEAACWSASHQKADMLLHPGFDVAPPLGSCGRASNDKAEHACSVSVSSAAQEVPWLCWVLKRCCLSKLLVVSRSTAIAFSPSQRLLGRLQGAWAAKCVRASRHTSLPQRQHDGTARQCQVLISSATASSHEQASSDATY